MDYLCAICSQPIKGIFRGDLVCHDCYLTWREAIENKEPWVSWMVSQERNRRYKEKKMREQGISLIHLGDNDIADLNGERKIVYKYRED